MVRVKVNSLIKEQQKLQLEKQRQLIGIDISILVCFMIDFFKLYFVLEYN